MITSIIFDLDGVLVDAKELHYIALNKALGKFGYTITRDEHISTYDGLPTRTKMNILTEKKGLPVTLYDKIWMEKQLQTSKIVNTEYTYDERIRSILKQLVKDGYKLSVCSNAIRVSVKMMLLRKGFLEYMEFYISNQDIILPKPNPEMYLRAMITLGVGPSNCIILEDSNYGRQAAVASGATLCKIEDSSDVTLHKIRKSIREANDD